MKVSVVMPVHNKAPFVREAAESILKGTFGDLELIAVDDKSTDASLDVLRSIADPRMRIIELPVNRGPAGAMNAGLDAAQGEYIVRMDADDISVPERIALQVDLMDTRGEIGASGGQVRLFGAEDTMWPFPLMPDACAAQLLFGVPVSQGASIIRRGLLEKHALRYDAAWPRVGEDWLFWLQMGKVSRFMNMDQVLIHYRRGAQNISHGRNKVEDFTLLQEEALRSFGIPHTAEELDLQLMGSFIFKVRPSKHRVKALRTWYDRLLHLNKELAFAPQAAFGKRIAVQWDRLFHYLPRFGTAPALEHLAIDGKWPLDRLAYLAKYRINALLGNAPTG
jgi:glycosyltransferase involved in cell wall biosynthesis